MSGFALYPNTEAHKSPNLVGVCDADGLFYSPVQHVSDTNVLGLFAFNQSAEHGRGDNSALCHCIPSPPQIVPSTLEPPDELATVNAPVASPGLCSSSHPASKRKFDGTEGSVDRSSKSSRTSSEQSAPTGRQIRSQRRLSSLDDQVDVSTESQSTVTTVTDSDEDHQVFLDIAGDGPLEQPKLDPRHMFAPLKEFLVPHGLAAAAQEMGRHGPQQEWGFAIEGDSNLGGGISEDSEWVKIPSHTRFCCPFYTRDPTANQACLQNHDLVDIFAVKRHVCRDHRVHHYCPVCFDVFENAKTRDDHIRERNCPRRRKSRRPRVTEKQVKQVARVRRDLPEPEQWYSIFRILFPRGQQEPPSPYLDGELELAVASLREFWDREGRRIVSEFVASKIPEFEDHESYASIPDEERTLAALHSSVITDILEIVIGDAYRPSLHSGWKEVFSV